MYGGGGKEINDFAFKICGITIYTTHRYKAYTNLPSLQKNTLINQSLATDDKILDKLQSLCANLDTASKQTIYAIISRERQAYHSPNGRIYTLTQQELDELNLIATNFYPKIFEIAPKIFYYNGYLLPIKQFETSVFWHKHSLNILKTLPKIKNKDIIDVGGFIGDSVLILKDFTTKTIHTFEPTSSNHKLLLQTLKLNNISRAIPVKKALGSKPDTLTMSIYGGASSLIRTHKNSPKESIEVTTLDIYAREHNLDIGFIKVDIEGFEMEFLKGARATIESQKPAMLISIYHKSDDFFYIKPMLESWNLGYTFYVHKPIDGGISGEMALFCEVLDSSDLD